MKENQIDLINDAMDELLRVPIVRAVLMFDNKDVILRNGPADGPEQDVFQSIVTSVLPAAKRMAEKSGNVNEAQAISLPGDDLHLLIFWLASDYYLLVSFSRPVNPNAPPESIVKACNLIRLILLPPGQHDEKAISSAEIEMETAIYIDRLVYSRKIIKETGTQPNPYDLAYGEAQAKKVVEIARDILSSRKGIIEGARLLVQLRPTVTRDDFDADFLPFVAIVAETEDLPVGRERKSWAVNVLVDKDKEIQQAEELYRDRAFAACQVLIARFDGSP